MLRARCLIVVQIGVRFPIIAEHELREFLDRSIIEWNNAVRFFNIDESGSEVFKTHLVEHAVNYARWASMLSAQEKRRILELAQTREVRNQGVCLPSVQVAGDSSVIQTILDTLAVPSDQTIPFEPQAVLESIEDPTAQQNQLVQTGNLEIV